MLKTAYEFITDVKAFCEAYFAFNTCSRCSVVGFDRSIRYRYVQMDQSCLSFTAILHTLFHILGRYHEHERVDREKYVQIIEENTFKGITFANEFNHSAQKLLQHGLTCSYSLLHDFWQRKCMPYTERTVFSL